MSNVKIVLKDIEDIIKLRKKLKGYKIFIVNLPPKEEKEKINIFFDFSKKI